MEDWVLFPEVTDTHYVLNISVTSEIGVWL